MAGSDMQQATYGELIELTTKIVSAYVSRNDMRPENVPGFIAEVYQALARATDVSVPAPREELKPAVPIKRSVQPDHIVCLEDGKKFKSLKRHIRTHYNLTPEAYREKWNLPPDYPMVAPNYARERSALAKKMGLGTRRTR